MINKIFFSFLFYFLPFNAFAQETKVSQLIGHRGKVTSAQFSPDGKKIVTASLDNTAKIWDIENHRLLNDLTGHTNGIISAQFSPDGKKIVTVSLDYTAKIWSAETGKLLFDSKGHTNNVIFSQFSPDGKKIVTASSDNTTKIWDVETGRLLHDLTGHTYWVKSAQFSPDGKKIVTASWDNTAKIWDVETGNLLNDLIGHTFFVNTAQFSPDGKMIVTGSSDNTAKIWDTQTGKLLHDFIGHTNSIFSAAFSPDSKKIATGSSDNTIKIWDVETGKLLYTYQGQTGTVNTTQFSPDGKKIVTASSDNTAKIWDVETGKLLCDLTGHTGCINSAQFSTNGGYLVTASDDKTARIWILDSFIVNDIKSNSADRGIKISDSLITALSNKFESGINKFNEKNYKYTASYFKTLAYDFAKNEILDKIWACEYYAGLSFYNMGVKVEALNHFKSAVKTIELNNPDINELFNFNKNENSLQDVYKKVISISIDLNQADSALLYLEKYNQFGMRKLRRIPMDSSDTRGVKIKAIANSLDSLNILSIYNSLALNKIYAEKRTVLENDYLVYIDSIFSGNPELTNCFKNNINPTDFFSQSNNISKSTILVEYLYDENSLYIFVVSSDTLIIKEVTVGDTIIENYTNLFLEKIIDPTHLVSWMATSVQLYNILIKPILPLIQKYEKLAIIPTNKLVNLPFQALCGRTKKGEDPQYLIQSFEIYYPYSLKYTTLTVGTRDELRPVAFGNPDGTLPGAEIEVNEINAIIPSSDIFVRDEATKTKVKAITSKNNILHLATHGILDYNSYNKSYFIFSKDSANQDGKLTLDDVRRINELREYDMAVLSSCNSAVSENKIKGWINNPARVFLDTGVESVIATLWPVRDKSTCLLMKEFYNNLSNGYKSEALRKAQLKLLKNPEFSHPFFWAPFILLGNSQ